MRGALAAITAAVALGLAGCAGTAAPPPHRHHLATASVAPTPTARHRHARPTSAAPSPTHPRSTPLATPRPGATPTSSAPRPTGRATRRPRPTRSAPRPTASRPTADRATPHAPVRIPTPPPTSGPSPIRVTPAPTPVPLGLHVSGDLTGLLPGRATCTDGGHAIEVTGTLGGHPATLTLTGADPGATVRLPNRSGTQLAASLLGTPLSGHRSTWEAGTATDPGSGLLTVGRTGRSGSLALYLDATAGNSVAVDVSGAWSCG